MLWHPRQTRMAEHMIIDITITYGATVKKRRSRHLTENNVKTTVKARIEECRLSDLPIVARYTEALDPYARGPATETYSNVLGWHANGLVEQLRVFNSGEQDGVRRDAAWLTQVCATPDWRHNDDAMAGDPFKYAKRGSHADVIDEADIAQMPPEAERARAEAIAKALSTASAMVLVDGLVWRPVGEPRLVSEVGFRGRGSDELVVGASVLPAWRFNGQDHRLRASSTYRLDQSDMVLAMHGFLLSERDAVARMPSITVERPDLLRYRAEQECLAEAARSTVDGMAKSLEMMPLSGLVAYANLRDALPDYERALAGGGNTEDDLIAGFLEAARDGKADTQVTSALRRLELSRAGVTHMSDFRP